MEGKWKEAEARKWQREITCLNLVTILNILIENFEKISKRVRLIEKVLFFEIVVYV